MNRHFEILTFIVRNGAIYRKDRLHLDLDNTVNTPAEIIKYVRPQVAMGRNVLVLECETRRADGYGSWSEWKVKIDWSRIQTQYMNRWNRLNIEDARAMVRGINLSPGSFHALISETYNLHSPEAGQS